MWMMSKLSERRELVPEIRQMNLVNTIAWKIFADLPYYKIVHAGQVCRRWHALSLDDLLWKLVLVRHFNIKTPVSLRPGATSWREEFIRMIDEVPSVLTDLPDHHRQSGAVHVSFAHTKNMFSVCYKICGFAVWSAGHPCTRLFGIDNDENVEDNERIEAYNSRFNSSDELLLVHGMEVDCPNDAGDRVGRISIYSVVDSDQFCLVMWVATEMLGDIHNLWVTNSTFLSFKRRSQYDNEILQYGSEHYMEVYLNNINPVDVEDGSNDVVEGNGGDVDNKVDGCGDDMDNKEIRDNNVDVDGEEDVRNENDEDKEVYFNYTLSHVYLTSDWEKVNISPIKSHEDDVPNILVPIGLMTFEAPGAYAGHRKLPTEIALLDKEGKVEDLKVRNLTNKAFEQTAVLGYCLSPDQRTCYINAGLQQASENLSNLGQFDGDETLQVIPLDLASRAFGPALTGHKGRIGLTHSFCPDVSRDYVGCGSEVNGGYLWDRHYGCLVSVLQSKHEQHKALNAFEDEIQDDVNEDTEEEDLTMLLKKMYLEEDDEDEEYWDEDEEYWVMPPCGCGTFIQRKQLPLNEDEETKVVEGVAIDPVNQDVTVTVGGRTAGRIGRIKVFRSKKWIRENRLAA